MWRRILSLSIVTRMVAFLMLAMASLAAATPAFATDGGEDNTAVDKARDFWHRLFDGEEPKLVWSVLVAAVAFMLLYTMKKIAMSVKVITALGLGVVTWVVYSGAFQGERDSFARKVTNISHTVDVSQNNSAWLFLLVIPPVLVLVLLWSTKKLLAVIAAIGVLLLANYLIVEYVSNNAG